MVACAVRILPFPNVELGGAHYKGTMLADQADDERRKAWADCARLKPEYGKAGAK